MVLRGPELQARLFGNPGLYPSADMDLLIRSTDRARLGRVLEELGFSFHPGNDLWWRASGHVRYVRSGFVVDIHWSLARPAVPGFLLRSLERSLWGGAIAGASGFLEPEIEPLLVMLALDAASAGWDRPGDVATVRAAANQVVHWDRVWRIAAVCHGVTAVRTGLGEPEWGTDRPRVLDDLLGAAVAKFSRGVHDRPLIKATGDFVREYVSYERHGIAVLAPSKIRPRILGHHMEVWEGVCGPGTWSRTLIDAWTKSAVCPQPLLVEIGTGSGSLAILAAMRRPDAQIHATDISFRAWRNARANVRRHRQRVTVHRGSLFDPLPPSLRRRVNGVVAHLPSVWLGGIDEYKPDEIRAPRETYEGQGGDGLDLMRRLLREAPPWLAPTGSVVISMESWQWEVFRAEIVTLGYDEVSVNAPTETGRVVTLRRSRSLA